MLKPGHEWQAEALATAATKELEAWKALGIRSHNGYLRGVRDTLQFIAGKLDPRDPNTSADLRAVYLRYLDGDDA